MTEINIDGRTGVFGLIGRSVGYSLSPLIHNELSRIMGINSVYVTFSVLEEASVGKAIEGAHALGIKGLNVTVPYKKSVMPFLCGIEDDARKIGAVNTLMYTEKGYVGYNTDVYGVFRTFRKHGIDLGKQSLLLLGAGGGAAAAAFGAALSGARRIHIANRSNNNSELLARRIKKYYNNMYVGTLTYDEVSAIKEDYFILQATSLGMNKGLSPVDVSVVENSTGVFDIIYTPLKTDILKEAERLKKPSINGVEMLVHQAIRAFEIWNGTEVSEEYSVRVLKRVVECLN